MPIVRAGDVAEQLEAGEGSGGSGAGEAERGGDAVAALLSPARPRPAPRPGSGSSAGPAASIRFAPGPSIASSTSWASRTTQAPPASRLLGPAEAREVTGPGTAPRSRPRSAARSAVISEPERAAASTTTVIPASAAMIRLRAGKVQRQGAAPGGNSEMTRPCSQICRQSERCAAG